MTVHTFYDDAGRPYYLDDDTLVLPEGATEADRLRAWELQSAATAFWLLFPEQ